MPDRLRLSPARYCCMSWLQNRLFLYRKNYIKLSYQLSVRFYPIPSKDHACLQQEDAADPGVSAGEASRPKGAAAALRKPIGRTCQSDMPCRRMRVQGSCEEGKSLAETCSLGESLWHLRHVTLCCCAWLQHLLSQTLVGAKGPLRVGKSACDVPFAS